MLHRLGSGNDAVNGILDARGPNAPVPCCPAHLIYWFAPNADCGASRGIRRHRMAAMTHSLLGVDFGSARPRGLDLIGETERPEECMDTAYYAYPECVYHCSPEYAEYALPVAYRLRLLVSMDLPVLFHFIELRAKPLGHPAYHAIAQRLWRIIHE